MCVCGSGEESAEPPYRIRFAETALDGDQTGEVVRSRRIRQQTGEHAGCPHRLDGGQGVGCRQELQHLGLDPLARKRGNRVCCCLAGLERRRVRRSLPVPGMESEEAEDAEVILGDARRGVADEADAAGFQIGLPAEIVVQRAVGRRAHGVDGEVAARRVLPPVVGERDLGVAAVGALVAPERRDLVAAAACERRDGAVRDPARDGAGLDACVLQQGQHALRRVGGADVDIVTLAAEQRVAHAAAHEADVGAASGESVDHRTGARRRHPGGVDRAHPIAGPER